MSVGGGAQMLRGGRTLGLYVRQRSPLACPGVMGGDARVGGFRFPPASALYGHPPAQKDPSQNQLWGHYPRLL